MDRDLMIEALKVAVNHYEYEGDPKKAEGIAILITDIEENKTYKRGFQDGGEYVLNELADLYDGITDTDIYSDFMTEEETN